jgi:hypothetical protein
MGARSHEVRGRRATGNYYIAPPSECISDEEFKRPRFVAREAKTSQVIPLKEE